MTDVAGLVSTTLEVKLNGVFTDITSYVRLTNGGQIVRTVGRSNEVDDSQPGSLAFTLDNIDGRFYPDSPTVRVVTAGVVSTIPNPYYPYFTEDAQVRWKVNDGSSRLRFLGWITDITPTFDGGLASSSTVAVTATDTLGRMSRGTLRNQITQEQLAPSGLICCYPIGEPAGAQMASDVTGQGKNALITKIWGGAPGFSYGNPGPGAESATSASFGPPAATTGYGKYLLGTGVCSNGLSGTGYSLSAWFRINPAGNGQYDIVNVSTPDRTGTLQVQTNSSTLPADNALVVQQNHGGSSVVGAASPACGDGGWHHVLVAYDQGGNLLNSYLDGTLWESRVPLAIDDYADLRVGGGPAGPFIFYGSVASVACYNTVLNATTALSQASAGVILPGTTLSTQADSVATYAGFTAAHETGFGPQAACPLPTAGGSALDALLTVVRGEGGLVYDNGAGLYLRARSALKSLTVGATFDIDLDLAQPPTLSRGTINKVAFATATSYAGSQTVTDPTAVTSVGTSANVTLVTSLASTVELNAIASNRVAQGLNRKTRLSQVVVDLLTAGNNLYSAVLTLQPGDRIRVSNVPSEFMGVTRYDSYALGWTEALSWDGYVFTYDLVPADAPAELGFDTFRFASDGTSTGSTITATATALAITSPGATWSQNNADYPMDVDYNGERITLNTAPGVGPSPQGFTGVTRGVAPTIARAHTSGEPIEVWDAIRFSY